MEPEILELENIELEEYENAEPKENVEPNFQLYKRNKPKFGSWLWLK
jgi:hypothetical protein